MIETFEPSPGLHRGLAFDWWWLAAPAALLALLAGWLMRRRGRAGPEQDEPEETPEAAPVVERAPPAQEQEAPPPQPAPSLPDPQLAAQWSGDKLAVALEVGRLSATLVNATLTWQLSVENRGDDSLGPIMVAGDMIAAHSSLPVEQQLATDGQPLELLDEIASIPAGERVDLQGEFRMPLSSVNPIRAGSALLFIPVLRFRVEAEGTSTLATFVVGETPPVAAAALLPFRLDLGPRVWPRISQRPIDRAPLPA